ncbi:MAG TPA: hypothetical protein VND70_01465 [Acidimicrobiales bacterium]|nr:hypothetical protein [Acidimicrobiales bacterium]
MPPLLTILCIATVIMVVLWQLHPGLLLSGSSSTGGDNGGHYALPAFLNSNLLPQGHLTGWDPGWYDGFPLYTYYFILPDLLVALASHVIPYGVAFKLGTVLGSLLLPVAAWAMGRLCNLRRAFPGALAAITLCYLFDYTFTIDGGNLFSTLAGEYSFSLGLSLALLFLGLFARGLRDGRHRGWTAVVLAACILSHLVPALFAICGALLLIGFELLPPEIRPRDVWRPHPSDRAVPSGLVRRRALWWGFTTLGIAGMLAAFWWVPFGADQSFANSMGYTNVHTFVLILLPQADWWALVVAGLSALAALALRSRFGILVTLLGAMSALAVIFDPQGSLYNTRFLPLWFICVFLMVGWGIATAVTGICDLIEWRWADHARRRAAPSALWPWAAVAGPLVALAVALAVVVTPFVLSASTLQAFGITAGPNQVTNWAVDNYSGYEGKPAYSEYRALVQTMERVGRTHGCGQAMWEYNSSLNRFGTPMALMLLPYWSHGCIGSMEGLLFESSATTPYHFLNQAELSVAPSDPMVGLDYSTLNVTLGIEHLQLLGVRYFMASSPQVQAAASADPSLEQVASSGPWTSCCYGTTAQSTTTWKIYRVLHSPIVAPLPDDPAVQVGIGAGQSSWLRPAESWYDLPSRWNVELAASGPPSWPRVAIGDPRPPRHRTALTVVTRVHEGADTISFHVSRLGTPVLVKISYFPNWQASGATGPYRVTPNLMVVVPTAHVVTLHYGKTGADEAGDALTILGMLALVAGPVWSRLRKRPDEQIP